jgi:two-component system sensor histidine kinase RegB
VTFIVSAALVAHYVSSLAQSLRERDRQLAYAREEALRNERIVALGTLSAGAAHELGTPLATMSVLAEDMARRHTSHPELAADVSDLQTEIANCKRILNALTQATGSTRGEGGGAESADLFLERSVDRWQLVRPGARATLRWDDSSPAPALVADHTLEQALQSLLNNAADASPEGFEVAGRADGSNVVIDILDGGPGLTEEAQARAGELFFSTKAPESGMGIGLFLASATIKRFGGSVRLFNRSTGGCCTRITLPFLVDRRPGGER